jgi:hypothetical protein
MCIFKQISQIPCASPLEFFYHYSSLQGSDLGPWQPSLPLAHIQVHFIPTVHLYPKTWVPPDLLFFAEPL